MVGVSDIEKAIHIERVGLEQHLILGSSNPAGIHSDSYAENLVIKQLLKALISGKVLGTNLECLFVARLQEDSVSLLAVLFRQAVEKLGSRPFSCDVKRKGGILLWRTIGGKKFLHVILKVHREALAIL